MSYSISTLLTRNLHDVFGENDPARRRAAIDEICTEDCVFYDPKGGVYPQAMFMTGSIRLSCPAPPKPKVRQGSPFKKKAVHPGESFATAVDSTTLVTLR